jgi:hypothetical protein
VGGVGSGNWYRFNKKNTSNECHSVDVRYLHRNGLLEPGHYFSLRWSRAGRQTGSIGGVAYRDQVTLLYRHRRGPGGEWEDVKETVPLTWTACNFGGERPWSICPGAGCGQRVAIIYGPGKYFLCRHCYDLAYQSQGGQQNVPGFTPSPEDQRERLGGSANMMEPFPAEAQGNALEYLRLVVLGAPRGGDGAAYRHEGVARQGGEEGRIALLEGLFGNFSLSRDTAQSTRLLPREVLRTEI